MSEGAKAFIIALVVSIITGIISYYTIEAKNKKAAKKDGKNAVGYSIAYSLLAFIVAFGLATIFLQAKETMRGKAATKKVKGWITPKTKVVAGKTQIE